MKGLLLFLERSGFAEETYHTFSYSPVYDDGSRIAGMLCVVTEVTERVIGERRLRVLRDLAARGAGVETVQDAADRLIGVLEDYPFDVPFSCLYLIEEGGQTARLAAGAGLMPDSLRPERIDLTGDSSPWPLAHALSGDTARLVALNNAEHVIPSPVWNDSGAAGAGAARARASICVQRRRTHRRCVAPEGAR